MKRLIKFRYPKIAGLVLAIILAYIVFSNPIVEGFVTHLNSLSYLGLFIAGLLFSFGFTSPFSAGFFITLNPSNVLIAGIIGGAGALIADLVIFGLVRFSFKDEFQRLEKTKLMQKTARLIEKSFGHKIRMYLMYTIAGIFIASPLPDEAGIIMLAGLTKIKVGILAVISFILNTIGILILLSL
jgi:hypothetical protein